MQTFIKYLSTNNKILYLIAILLLFPALLINLGLMPFSSDEPIRGLVALEMIISDNFITPTLNGQYYYNKLPLFNWILIFYFKIIGNYNELAIRIPTIVSMFVYGFIIFFFVKKHFGNKIGLLNALVFITAGDIFFWDSLLGLIDITYSWLTFLSFMIIYHFYQKGKIYHLFIFSYFLTALGFMMKGLPSIVFQGVTLFVFFIFQKQFKKLFSIQHLVGGMIFLIIIGAYFFIYNQYNSVESYFPTLWTESSQRTVIRYGWWNTVSHLFTFPVEMLYHFTPWTILIISCFRKNLIREIFKHPFIKYCLLIFIANIIVYWTSPETHPRYLLMLFPLFFTILIFFYFKDKSSITIRNKIIEYIFIIFCFLCTIAPLVALFLNETKDIKSVFLKSMVLFILSGFFTFLYIKIKNSRLIVLVIIVILLRIGFNWFVLPAQYKVNSDVKFRENAVKIGKITSGEELYIFKNTYLHEITSLYITRERMKILERKYKEIPENVYFIIDKDKLKGIEHIKYYEFECK
ncbi:MAG: glycosyltransferase family 39 protein, partial [Bacteroidales bacterium]|nr:glycosyltransferase family 39 protein [Bacteroidales bacterium]